jgi:aspartate-semialdehyde dehydrogenase
MASVSVNFANNPSREVIMDALQSFNPENYRHKLPSQPEQIFHVFEEPNRPQTKLDRETERGMGISIGRLRPDTFFDWGFIALSHNTLRGAAGGAVLTAELLVATGYVAAA